MKTAEFTKFLKAKKRAQEAMPAIDWEKEKKEWLDNLDGLYGICKDALKEYIKSGDIRFDYTDIVIEEEDLGAYSAPVMKIIMGADTVTLRPVARNVIAAKGKVEMEGPKGSATLILVDSRFKRPGDSYTMAISSSEDPNDEEGKSPSRRIAWEWKFVIGPPYREFFPLKPESLQDMLMKVAGGE